MYIDRVLRYLFDRVGLSQHIRRFRDDMMEITLQKRSLGSGETTSKIKRDIQHFREKSAQEPFSDLSILLGIFTFALGNWLSIPFSTLGSVLLGLAGILRGTTVGMMAYKRPVKFEQKEVLVFKRAWNKGVVSKYTNSILLPLVGLVIEIAPKGYQTGLSVIDWMVDEN